MLKLRTDRPATIEEHQRLRAEIERLHREIEETEMGKLTIEFNLSEDAAILLDDSISIDLGHNVQLKAKRPRGLERINSCVLQIVMDVEGDISARTSENQPVVLEEAREDRSGEA